MQTKRFSPDWAERYAQVYDVPIEEGEEALTIALAYGKSRGIKCQAKGCPNLAAPFIRPASPKVLVLRYFCPVHWLIAVEKAHYEGIDFHVPEDKDND